MVGPIGYFWSKRLQKKIWTTPLDSARRNNKFSYIICCVWRLREISSPGARRPRKMELTSQFLKMTSESKFVSTKTFKMTKQEGSCSAILHLKPQAQRYEDQKI